MVDEWVSDFIINYSADTSFIDVSKKIYEKNYRALKKYDFLRCDVLLNFEDLNIIPIKLESNKYTYYDKAKKCFGKIVNIKKQREQVRFFEDIGRPLLIKNEFNVYKLEYLCDNIRSSDDYGGDNHIYLYYEDELNFDLLLCVEDITAYLDCKKLIFMFDGDLDCYPMDFKKKYSVDYSNTCKPIAVNEIHRLFCNLSYIPCGGNTFFMGVLDWHPNVLSIKGFGLSDFVFIYDEILMGKTVKEVQSILKCDSSSKACKSFLQIFNEKLFDKKINVPNIDVFFEHLHSLFLSEYKPNRSEWLKGIFLAYSLALGRKFSDRIVPAIKFETHHIDPSYDEKIRLQKNDDLFREFKYCYKMIPLRYLISANASMFYKHAMNKKEYNYIYCMIMAVLTDFRLKRMYLKKDDEMLDFTRMLRLEDFKKYPQASLASLCDFLDIPWNENVTKITANGMEYEAFSTIGYNDAPIYKRYYQFCNPFDYYRIEVVMTKYWKKFGYEPIVYKENITYTKDEILKMFELPFQCELFHFSESQTTVNMEARRSLYKWIEKRLSEDDAPLDDNGEKLIPIDCLRPKEEYMCGKI